MKILIISPGYYPVPAVKGGAVENLIENLVRCKEITEKHKITLYTIYDKEAISEEKNIKCQFKYINVNKIGYKIKRIIRHIINKYSNKYIGNEYINSVVKDIKKCEEKYDIIIVQNQPEYGLILDKIKKNSKLILHLHNDYLNIHTKNCMRIYNIYDRIFSISNFLNDRVNQIDPSVSKSKLLYNGVDITRFDPNKFDVINLRKKYSFDKNDFIFVYAGRIVKEKGIKELINAFSNINNKKAKLLILGKRQKGGKSYYNEILKLIKKDKNIILKENVSYNKIPELYAISNVGIVPSIWNEPFGLVVVEILASGLPVIASKQGALKEIINPTIEGRLVEYDKDFINNLTQEMIFYLNIEEDKYKLIKSKAVQDSKKFTNEIYVQNFLRLIEEEKK